MAKIKAVSKKKPLKSTVSATAEKSILLPKKFPIVGIGASAGGLEAMELFFKNVPKGSGMAFVVVQHLDPTHVGILPELLQRTTTMKVQQASDGLTIKPNNVYVIPPNKSMSILNDVLHLFVPVETRGLRLPVDFFFVSLALDRREQSIGIILSGMGNDGNLGIKAIKENKGLVLVQDPATAKFNGMPGSAVQVVQADAIAAAEELPAKLLALLKHAPPVVKIETQEPDSQSDLDKIIILLRQQSGNDFSLYKKNTLMRRVERRKLVHQIPKLKNYVRFCQENPVEIGILFKELLIGVTSFFRDEAVWEKFKSKTLPDMLKELPDGYTLRAWVAGCSTGEEAYSLAIIFKEIIEKSKKRRNIHLQIFATDLDADAIEIARRGFFSLNIAENVSEERLQKYFTQSADGYRLNAAIREMVVFATQSVIKDPPFTRLEILTCRNMLIYMEVELQKKIIALFNYSLNAGGILLLGSAETLGAYTDGFETLDDKLKFFKKTISPSLPISRELTDFPSSFSSTKRQLHVANEAPKLSNNIQIAADQILLQRYAPPSVLVNEKGDIIYITGRTGKYLEPAAGKANLNIYAMAKDGIRQELPAAFKKATQRLQPVEVKKIKIDNVEPAIYVDLIVQCMETPATIKGMILVVFKDVVSIEEQPLKIASPDSPKNSILTRELETKLNQSFEELRSTKEEMQTSQEELKSTNEELQSTNEELQSTNEELTTSKEEMQSLNEELQTVNTELQNRVADFVHANNDMKNLLNSTKIATLFLDKQLNIRRYTDEIINIFKLRHSDIGRPFTDLVTNLKYPNMETDVLQVLKTLASIETPIITNDGRWFKVRIMPYRTLDDHIDGLVITFFNITLSKKLELELKKVNEALQQKEITLAASEMHFRCLFEAAKEGILLLDADTGKITNVNPYLVQLLGFSKEAFLEKTIWEIGLFKDIVANKDKFAELQAKELVEYNDLPLETIDKRKINVAFISNVYTVNKQKVIQCFIRETAKAGGN
jgi:two-component system CheB/CheR fusion protein